MEVCAQRRFAPLLVACLALLSTLSACERAPPPQPETTSSATAPASRIVTLSPHLAELVYEAGAGDRLIGVVEFSDYPDAVRTLPRVGDAFRVDYEALTALRPDLVLAWTSGNPPETVQRVRELGIRVESLEPTKLADIATHVELIGELAGTRAAAATAAARFRARLAALGTRTGSAPVRIFVEIAERPWFTVTDRHFIGQGLALCGRNVFGDLPGITAVVALEAILDAAPELIVASDMAGESGSPLTPWARWPRVPAVANGQLYLIDADVLSRPSGRILDGIETLCRYLDLARAAQRPLAVDPDRS